jgi:pyrroloquinoline-quinone synthase
VTTVGPRGREVKPAGDLERRLRATVAEQYHHLHPFNLAMHAGTLTRPQVQDWIINRFHYQRHIPIKDALILSKLPSREARRLWIRRIVEQDGGAAEDGGLDAWLRLGEAAGITRMAMVDESGVRPPVRFAVDAYVNFCRLRPWPEAVAASLTELLAPQLMARRIAAFQEHYTWVADDGLEYFRRRVTQGERDAHEALGLVLKAACTPPEQEAVVCAVRFKCEVLWSLLDALGGAPGTCGG